MPNELDLDISKFDTGLAEAVNKVKSLESEVTDANKLLREMQYEFEALAKTNRNLPSYKRETGKQDDLATDIKQQKIAIRESLAELKEAKTKQRQIEKEIKQSASQDQGQDKGFLSGFNLSKTRVGLLGAAYAALTFAHNLVTTGRGANELTRTLDELDRVPFQDNLTRGQQATQTFKGAILDLAASIAQIPIVGSVFDILTAGALKAAQFKKQMIEVDKTIKMQAVSSSDLIGKMRALEEERAKTRKEMTRSTVSRVTLGVLTLGESELLTDKRQQRGQNALDKIEKSRLETLNKFKTALMQENEARNAEIAGGERAAKLAQIELERRERIAKVQDAVKDPHFGGTTAQGKQMVAAAKDAANEEAKIRKEAANRDYRISMDTLSTASRTAELKLHGAIGAQMAAGEELRLQERILKERQKETPEAIAQQKAKVAEAEASYEMATRNVALARIENSQNQAILKARLQGYRAESATAEVNRQAALARASQFAVGTPERKQQEISAEAAAQDKTRAQLNEKIVGYQMQLNEARERAGIGEEAERKELQAQLQFNEQRRAALVDDARQNHRNHDQELSDIDAETNALAKQYEVSRRARSDEAYQIAQQTAEMEAQQKGLQGLAAEEQIRAKYTAQIVEQYRKGTQEGRANAANLQTQQAIELRRIRAQEHDETPEQRRRAKAADRVEARKARQQEARDAEMLTRGVNGAQSDLIDTARRKHESYKEQQARIAQAKSDAEDWPRHVREIHEILQKGG